jgi:hypothetical protein
MTTPAGIHILNRQYAAKLKTHAIFLARDSLAEKPEFSGRWQVKP